MKEETFNESYQLQHPIVQLELGMTSKQVLVIGCGGTGARLIPPLIKVLPQEAEIYLIDGDIVEARNLARQHFSPEDVGHYKAEVLAERYDRVGNGPRVIAVPRFVPEGSGNEGDSAPYAPFGIDWDTPQGGRRGHAFSTPLVFGCVDSGQARYRIMQWVAHLVYRLGNVAYVDVGNGTATGQAVVAYAAWRLRGQPLTTEHIGGQRLTHNERDHGAITLYATGLPAFAEVWDPALDEPDDPGCLRIDTQTVQVNQLAATAAFLAASPFIQGTPLRWAGMTFTTDGVMTPVPWDCSYLKWSDYIPVNYYILSTRPKTYDGRVKAVQWKGAVGSPRFLLPAVKTAPAVPVVPTAPEDPLMDIVSTWATPAPWTPAEEEEEETA